MLSSQYSDVTRPMILLKSFLVIRLPMYFKFSFTPAVQLYQTKCTLSRVVLDLDGACVSNILSLEFNLAEQISKFIYI